MRQPRRPTGTRENLEPLVCDGMPRQTLAWKADGTQTRETHRNFTDPDSDLMQSFVSYLQSYNFQVAVDSDHLVIVAVGLSSQPPDVEHLEHMLKRITATVGARPDVKKMEAGYWTEDNVKGCSVQDIDT